MAMITDDGGNRAVTQVLAGAPVKTVVVTVFPFQPGKVCGAARHTVHAAKDAFAVQCVCVIDRCVLCIEVSGHGPLLHLPSTLDVTGVNLKNNSNLMLCVNSTCTWCLPFTEPKTIRALSSCYATRFIPNYRPCLQSFPTITTMITTNNNAITLAPFLASYIERFLTT